MEDDASTLEAYVLKALLRKQFYDAYWPLLRQGSIFSDNLREWLSTIEYLHSKSEDDLTEELVFMYLQETEVLSNSRVTHYMKLTLRLKEINLDDSLIGDFVKRLIEKSKAREVANIAIAILNGDKTLSLEDVRKYLDIKTIDSKYSVVSNELSDLIEILTSDNKLHFALEPLQEVTGGMVQGDLMIVFARPESGKSSFLAHNNVGYLRQGQRVLYIANEEPGKKVVLNHVRAACELSDADLLAGNKATQEWENIKNLFTLVDNARLTVYDIEDLVAKYEPQVLVVDQFTKLKLKGQSQQLMKHDERTEIVKFLREIAKTYNCLVIGVCQASAEAQDRLVLDFDMIDGSKTGVAGEATMIIGIGKRGGEDNGIRNLTVSKNKVNGWHGCIPVKFNPVNNVWSK